MYGGRGSEGAGGSGTLEEIRQIRQGEVVNGLECKQEDFELDMELDREPVELLEDRSDVMDEGGSSYDAGSGILDQVYGGICEGGRRGESCSNPDGK